MSRSLIDNELVRESVDEFLADNILETYQRDRLPTVILTSICDSKGAILFMEYLQCFMASRNPVLSGNLMMLALSSLDSCGYDDTTRALIYKYTNEICGGMGLDYSSPGLPHRRRRELLMKVINARYGCLYSLCFLMAWVTKGGNLAYIHNIGDLGHDLGLCYYIANETDIFRYYSRNETIDLFSDTNQRMIKGLSLFGLWNDRIRELNESLIEGLKKKLSN